MCLTVEQVHPSDHTETSALLFMEAAMCNETAADRVHLKMSGWDPGTGTAGSTYPSNVMRVPSGTPSGGMMGSTLSCASLEAHRTCITRKDGELNECNEQQGADDELLWHWE